jgi:hypothetical protein
MVKGMDAKGGGVRDKEWRKRKTRVSRLKPRLEEVKARREGDGSQGQRRWKPRAKEMEAKGKEDGSEERSGEENQGFRRWKPWVSKKNQERRR